METITHSAAVDNLAQIIEKVCQDHEPFIIDDKVVVMSLEDYRSLEETLYLLKSPTNARRLMEAIEEVETGGGTRRDSPEWMQHSRPVLGMITCIGRSAILPW